MVKMIFSPNIDQNLTKGFFYLIESGVSGISPWRHTGGATGQKLWRIYRNDILSDTDLPV